MFTRSGTTVAIIPARGGSKGIPKKNLHQFCGQPLIYWSVKQALDSDLVERVFVSSDDLEILEVAESFGAETILRPRELSGDDASSEEAWLHAIEVLANKNVEIANVVALQPTSPIRNASDIDNALLTFWENGYDSLLSVCEVEDRFVWGIDQTGHAQSINYDYKNRQRRQNLPKRYLENGSFYIFGPELLKKHKNRLAGKIGVFVMEKHKMFQIDDFVDLELCSIIMHGYGLDQQ